MKKSLYILALAAAGLTMTSCYDLERYPDDQISTATAYQTQDGCDMGIMGVYALMHDEYTLGKYFFNDGQGGIMFIYDQYEAGQKGTATSETGFMTNEWAHLYEGVARANSAIATMQKNKETLLASGMSDDTYAQYIAEAKFLRGMYYYYLNEFFADPVQNLGVPYYDETVDVGADYQNMLNARESLDASIKHVIDDMDVAIASLPTEWDAANSGRATKSAAYGFKGKAYLLQKDYSNALSAFQAIESLNVNKLYTGDWADMFKCDAADDCSEMIFSIQNMSGVGTEMGMPLNFMLGTRGSYGSCWNNGMVSNYAANEFDNIDGTEFDWKDVVPGFASEEELQAAYDANGGMKGTYTTVDAVRKNAFYVNINTSTNPYTITYPAGNQKDAIVASYAKRDPRLTKTIIMPFTEYHGWMQNADAYLTCYIGVGEKTVANNKAAGVLPYNNANIMHYLFRKFVCEGDEGGKITNRAYTPINFPLIRLADVYLMEAECYAKASQWSKCAEYVNKVRNRVGMPSQPTPSNWTEALKIIKKERTCELLGEGHAWTDMRRWGLMETLNGRREFSITGGASRYARVSTARDYAWPIPLAEIQKNSTLVQNTGWGE